MYGISQKLNYKMVWQALLLMSVMFMLFIVPASAETVEENSVSIENLETALTAMWLIIAGGIVFLMHAGFSLVEIGLTRTKNTANILMKNFMTVCLGIVVFWAVGWGIMYGADYAGLIGIDQFFLMGADNGYMEQLVVPDGLRSNRCNDRFRCNG